MKSGCQVLYMFMVSVAFAVCGWSQSSSGQQSKDTKRVVQNEKKATPPGKEMGKVGKTLGRARPRERAISPKEPRAALRTSHMEMWRAPGLHWAREPGDWVRTWPSALEKEPGK